MRLARFILIASLFWLASTLTASAATFILGTLADGTRAPIANSGSGAYNDDWLFSVTGSTTLNLAIDATGFIEFGNYTLYDSSDTVLMTGRLELFATNQTDSTSISAGDYRLNIQLAANSGPASYTGALGINVSAVPEPATWLLLAGGLGLLGFLRRHR